MAAKIMTPGAVMASQGVTNRAASYSRPFTAKLSKRSPRAAHVTITRSQAKMEPQGDAQLPISAALASAAGLLAPFLLDVDPAFAGNPLLTGKTVSLIHPAIMIFLFGSTAWTGWLGWQWRRARLIPAEVKELKAQLPKPDAEGNRASSPLDKQIAELEETRKALTKGGFRDRHWNWGSLLLGLGVLIAIEGPVNTYLRTGKLFPGPHLYAGAAIVVLWAAASSLVPAMQKGNDTARTTHIALNAVNLGLFAWQVPTGFEIVQKVWDNVPWP